MKTMLPYYKGQRYLLKTNLDIENFFEFYMDGCHFVWNRFRWINKDRLILGFRILRYREMAFFLTLWKKSEEFSWLKEIPSQLLQQTLMDLDKSYKDAFDRTQPDKRLPRYKKRQDKIGLRFPQGFKIENRRIKFPKIGWVGFFKSCDVGNNPRSITVNYECGQFYASILVEVGDLEPCPNEDVVGIDVGIAKFVTLSDGVIHESNDLSQYEKKVKHAQRKLARKQKGSKNRLKAKQNIQSAYRKQARARNDYIHKVSYEVSTRYAIAFVEDLRLKSMSRSARGTIDNPGKNVAAKRGLNRSLLNQGLGEFFRQITYKMEWRGGKVVPVDPRYTSQTCSSCGFKSAENRRSQACFHCQVCAMEMNADLNAAKNILSRGLEILAAGQAVSVCGEFARVGSVKQKPAGNREKLLAYVSS